MMSVQEKSEKSHSYYRLPDRQLLFHRIVDREREHARDGDREGSMAAQGAIAIG